MKIRLVHAKQTEDGIKWIEEQVHLIANELGIELDGPPEWDYSDHLNVKLAIEVAGQRKIQKLWRPDIDDSQGGNDQATREVQRKLQIQLREFLRLFLEPEPKKRIGF